MRKNLFALFASSVLLLASAQPVFAGGLSVAVYADPSGSVNNAGLYERIIRAYINPTLPCKDTQVTFVFNIPQDGDYIMTSSGNATYTMGDRTSNGCTMYAKMGSKVKGARQLEVDAKNGDTNFTGTAITVDFDGQYHGDSQTYRSSLDDPFGGNHSYEIKPGNPGVKTIKLEQTTPSENQEKDKTPNDTDMQKPTSATPDTRVEELNQKVASLEATVRESQKKQSVLETTVNNLVSWIKAHFSFFQ